MNSPAENVVVELNVAAPAFNLIDIFDRTIDLKHYKREESIYRLLSPRWMSVL